MEGKLPNFPVLFEVLGVFMYRLRSIANDTSHMTPQQISDAIRKLIERHSPSELDSAIDAYEEIVKTIYPESFGGCPNGNPRIKA